MSDTLRHPIQPLYTDSKGVRRFKANAIVRHLLDHGGFDLNKLACMDFSHEDRAQFAQLIGYSLGGYSELTSYVSDTDVAAAELIFEQGIGDTNVARVAVLEALLGEVKKAMRKPIAKLFGIHPDDLGDSP